MQSELLIKINGMTCAGCSQGLKKNLERIEFLSDVEIDVQSSTGKMIVVDAKPDKIQKIIAQVERMGYEAKVVN